MCGSGADMSAGINLPDKSRAGDIFVHSDRTYNHDSTSKTCLLSKEKECSWVSLPLQGFLARRVLPARTVVKAFWGESLSP